MQIHAFATLKEKANTFTVQEAVIFKVQNIERSEEHTSELQSRPHLVCGLLLEKKKEQGACGGGRRRGGAARAPGSGAGCAYLCPASLGRPCGRLALPGGLWRAAAGGWRGQADL